MKGLLTSILLLFLASVSVVSINPICAACHEVLSTIQHSIPPRPIEFVLEKIGERYCDQKHLQDKTVCKGAVDEMTHPITNSLWRHYTDPHSFCHKIRLCPKEYHERNLTSDIKKILEGKSAKQWEQPTERKTLKVMHISDLHPDLFYTVGAAAKCSEPVCCRSNITSGLSPQEALRRIENGDHLEVSQPINGPAAGYWGSLNSCDLPFQTLNLFLRQLKEMDLDLILWTGDNTPHDIWAQSQTYNLNFTSLISEYLRRHTKTRVVGAMGNHQSYPVNVYDYEGKRQTMLINGLAEAWRPWMDDKAYETLRTKGYFSISIPEMNNLKVISVNTQAQNDMNWFLLRNPTDPGGMLQWIEDELKQSEKNGQLVYIIGHISPKSALNDWSMRFNALSERYSYIIRGQYYGHSHRDHMGLIPEYGNKDKLAGYYFIAPSLTTYSDKHPQYRVLTVDYDSLQVLDYDQYKLDLTKYTKKEDKAHFELFYSFKNAYNLTDMTMKGGMTTFKEKLEKDKDFQIQYSYLQSSGVSKGHAGRDVYCDTTTSPQYGAECHGKEHQPGQLEKFAGPWRDLHHK